MTSNVDISDWFWRSSRPIYFMKTKLIFNFINCEWQKCGCVLFLRAFKQVCPKYFSHIDRVGLFCLGF